MPSGGRPARPMLFTQNPAKGGTPGHNRNFPELSNFHSLPGGAGGFPKGNYRRFEKRSFSGVRLMGERRRAKQRSGDLQIEAVTAQAFPL